MRHGNQQGSVSKRGLSMVEIMERYGTEEKCHAALVNLRCPSGLSARAAAVRAIALSSVRGCNTGSARPAASRRQRHAGRSFRPSSCRRRVGLEKFRAVNTIFGKFKTALSGTCHSFNFAKYAHRYLAELQYRFNRRFYLSVIPARLLRAAPVTSTSNGSSVRLRLVANQDTFCFYAA